MSGKFTADGLVIRLLFTRLLGARVHVFDGDNELVINPGPIEVVWGCAPDEVMQAALRWVERHQHEIRLMGSKIGVAA